MTEPGALSLSRRSSGWPARVIQRAGLHVFLIQATIMSYRPLSGVRESFSSFGAAAAGVGSGGDEQAAGNPSNPSKPEGKRSFCGADRFVHPSSDCWYLARWLRRSRSAFLKRLDHAGVRRSVPNHAFRRILREEREEIISPTTWRTLLQLNRQVKRWL